MTAILKVDTIQDTAGNNIINESSNTITIGASGDTTNIVGTLQNNGAAVGGDNTPAFAVKLSGDQTISSASETKITFDSELYDTDNAFASNKFTVPSGKGGKYFINLQTKLNVSTDYRGISSTIYKNGSAMQQIRSRIMFNSTLLNDGDTTLAATGVLDLSASDYIEGYAYIFSPDGGTIKVLADTYLTGFKLI